MGGLHNRNGSSQGASKTGTARAKSGNREDKKRIGSKRWDIDEDMCEECVESVEVEVPTRNVLGENGFQEVTVWSLADFMGPVFDTRKKKDWVDVELVTEVSECRNEVECSGSWVLL